MDEAGFEENRMVYDAVERCLERISEAAAKLGELAPVLIPDQPWRSIRALGTGYVTNTTTSGKTGSGKLFRTISLHFAPHVSTPFGRCASSKAREI